MSAVELSHGKQIQGRREQTKPRRESDRVQVDRVAVGHVAPEEPRHELEEQRFSEFEPAEAGWYAGDVRHRHADYERRHSDGEAGNRTRNTDIEQHAFGPNRFADADERTERARERRGHGQEERQRRVDVIIAAGEIVAQLMTAENRENRDAVPQTLGE